MDITWSDSEGHVLDREDRAKRHLTVEMMFCSASLPVVLHPVRRPYYVLASNKLMYTVFREVHRELYPDRKVSIIDAWARDEDRQCNIPAQLLIAYPDSMMVIDAAVVSTNIAETIVSIGSCRPVGVNISIRHMSEPWTLARIEPNAADLIKLEVRDFIFAWAAFNWG